MLINWNTFYLLVESDRSTDRPSYSHQEQVLDDDDTGNTRLAGSGGRPQDDESNVSYEQCRTQLNLEIDIVNLILLGHVKGLGSLIIVKINQYTEKYQ